MSSATADTVELRRFAGNGSESSAPRSGAGMSYFTEASRPDDGHARAAMEISVMLADGHSVKIADINTSVTANEMLDTVIDKLQLDRVEARRILGLWLISHSLSLQLKPTHMPCQIARKWPDTLLKFTGCSAADAEKEQPLLMLKRNVFVSRDEDLTVKDVAILSLLAAEARVCLLSGDWPCADEQLSVRLAGSLALLQFGPYDDALHTVDHCKKHISQLLPAKVIHRTSDKHRLYADVIQAHEESSTATPQLHCHKDTDNVTFDDDGISAVYRRFLTDCCELPYYGCVFFDAHVERAHKSLLKGKHQTVVIGVNTSGVYILDAGKREPLFGVLLTELTWEFVDACTCAEGSTACPHTKGYFVKGKDAVPYVLLQHREPPVASGSGSSRGHDDAAAAADPTLRVLAVYSKSAKLIDALIDNVMELLRAIAVPLTPPASTLGEGDHVDGPLSGDAAAQPSAPFVWQARLRDSTYGCCKYDRVRSQRFSATGERLDTPSKK